MRIEKPPRVCTWIVGLCSEEDGIMAGLLYISFLYRAFEFICFLASSVVTSKRFTLSPFLTPTFVVDEFNVSNPFEASKENAYPF
mgnify:CR=1 FL=1